MPVVALGSETPFDDAYLEHSSARISPASMKIATFNINNVNKRLDNLFGGCASPTGRSLPSGAEGDRLRIPDRGNQEGRLRRGVARAKVLERRRDACARHGPFVTRTALPGDTSDAQSRHIEAAVNGVLIATLYAPNSNPQPGPKFQYKLGMDGATTDARRRILRPRCAGRAGGDSNVVPADADVYPTKSYKNNALVQPEPRARFARLLDQGWIDAIRTLHPNAPMYTFWDYMRNRWQRDAGLRLDHLLLNPKAAKRLAKSGVDREVRGEENASDHAPAWIVLGDTPRTREARSNRSEARAKKSALAALRASPVARRPLLVIDGNSFAHRSYHALPKTILRCGRKQAGAILGFANLLLRLYREEQPRAVLVAWDTLEVPTYRHEKFPAYQSGREFDDALVEQLDALLEFVSACGFRNAKAPGFEADDFLAAAAAAEEKRGGTTLIASGDRDTFQLVSERTTILYPVRGKGMVRIDPTEVRARYGVDPAQVPDFIALRGDPADKLPGAPGVGATGAATLLERYGSLEAALKAGRFPTQVESLRLYRSIATMNRKAPLPILRNQKPTWRKAAALARDWDLKQLASRLDDLSANGER